MTETTSALVDAPPHWSHIVAIGPEAEAFLQGQLSQDLADLPAEGRWALLLAPDSVVITSCLVTTTGDGLTLCVPRELGEVALTRLKRFLLRTKCTLELVDVVQGPLDTSAEQIRAGVPGPAEFALGLTPHSFGPSFVATTISFTKGCFTGQELVGRLDARGSSVPWRLIRVSGPSAERVNEVLKSKGPPGPQGLTTAMHSGEGVLGLGVAHRTLLDSPELANASDVHVEPIT
jgi:folate-binding Fe-S cluster repair protein YgfZ